MLHEPASKGNTVHILYILYFILFHRLIYFLPFKSSKLVELLAGSTRIVFGYGSKSLQAMGQAMCFKGELHQFLTSR